MERAPCCWRALLRRCARRAVGACSDALRAARTTISGAGSTNTSCHGYQCGVTEPEVGRKPSERIPVARMQANLSPDEYKACVRHGQLMCTSQLGLWVHPSMRTQLQGVRPSSANCSATAVCCHGAGSRASSVPCEAQTGNSSVQPAAPKCLGPSARCST
jgi:hypothetical protein